MNRIRLTSVLNWKRCKPLLQWGLTAACLAYILLYLCQHRREVALVLRFNAAELMAMFALLALFLIFQSYRALILIRKCSQRSIDFFRWFQIYIVGITYNQLLPQLGNVYRGVVLKKEHHVTYTSYISAYASLAWIDTWQNMLIATGVLILTGSDLKLADMNAAAIMFAAALTIIGGPILIYRISKALQQRFQKPLWIHAKLSEILSIGVSNLRDPLFTVRITLSGLMVFFLMSALFYYGFRIVDAHLNLAETALFYTLFKLSTQVFVTPGNLGIREIAYGLLSRQIQMSMADGIIVSAFLRVLSYGMLLGLIAAIKAFKWLRLCLNR